MEATANFPSREGMLDCERALITSQVIHPLSTNSGGGGKVVRAPANKSGAAEVSRAAPQSRAQPRQTVGPHPTGHQGGDDLLSKMAIMAPEKRERRCPLRIAAMGAESWDIPQQSADDGTTRTGTLST